MIVRFLACFLLSLAMALTTPAQAAPARLVMVTEAWPPFRIDAPASPSGFSGIDIDLVAALEGRLGVAIEIQRRPWARALEMMKTGEADLITGIAFTAERAEYLAYVPTSYYSVTPVFYTQKGKAGLLRSYADLAGRSIGYSLNSAYFEPFNSDTKLEKVGLATEEQILKVLSLGRTELAIGTDPNMSYDVGRLGYRDLLEKTAWQPPQKTELFLALSRRSAASSLVDALDKALRSMVAEGAIEKIMGRYR